MLLLDFDKDKNKFCLESSPDEYIERDEFLEYIEFFKRNYLSYDKDTTKWLWGKNSTIDELLFILDEEGYEYSITEDSYDKIHELRNSYVDSFEKYSRVRFDISVLKEKIRLFDFQRTGVQFLIGQNRALCADEPGLGKTIQGISVFSHLYKKESIDGIVLIVRTGTAYDWKKSILDFSSIFNEDDILIVNNELKKDVFSNSENKILIIPNHLWKDCILYYKPGYKFGKSAKRIRWKEYVDIKEKWNKKSLLLMVDEAHEFGSWDSIKYKALYYHIHYFNYRYLLTATPAMNDFYKWKSLIDILDRSQFKMSNNAFKIYVSKRIGNRWDRYAIEEYDEEKVDSIRKDILSNYVIKRTKKELPEMKAKQVIKPIYFEMSEFHKNLYRKFVQEEIYKLETEYDNITRRLIFQKFPYLIQIIDNPLLLKNKISSEDIASILINKWDLSKDSRIEYLDAALSAYIEKQGEKIVLFDNHPDTIDQLGDRYKKYKPIIVHGRTGDKEEDKFKKQELFNDLSNDRCLIILNPQIGGASWNLNKGAKRTIFFTLPNDGVLYYQALDRCYRITNKEDAIVELLLFDHSIDIIRYERNEKRINLNDKYLDYALSKSELRQLLEGVV